MLKGHSFMVKSCVVVVVGGGGLLDYTVSFLGQVIVIVISRPRSLTIINGGLVSTVTRLHQLFKVKYPYPLSHFFAIEILLDVFLIQYFLLDKFIFE